MGTVAVTDKQRRDDRKARGVCIDCGKNPVKRFARCVGCRKICCERQARRMANPWTRKRHNARHRRWRAERVEVDAMCPKHAGFDTPCTACSEYRERYARDVENMTPRTLKCSRCGAPGHIRSNVRCPKRYYAGPIDDYARSQRPGYEPPHKVL